MIFSGMLYFRITDQAIYQQFHFQFFGTTWMMRTTLGLN